MGRGVEVADGFLREVLSPLLPEGLTYEMLYPVVEQLEPLDQLTTERTAARTRSHEGQLTQDDYADVITRQTTLKDLYTDAIGDLLDRAEEKGPGAQASLMRSFGALARRHLEQAHRLGMETTAENPVLDQRMRDSVANRVEHEKEHFLDFLQKIWNGEERMDRDQRRAMYGRTIDSMWTQGALAGTPDDVVITWVRTAKESCEDCIYLSETGPFSKPGVTDGPYPELQTLPRRGETQCLCILDDGAHILTQRGDVKLRDVVVGDLVLTHRGRWKPVLRIHRRASTTHVRQSMVGGVWCTAEHRWLTDEGWRTSYDARLLRMRSIEGCASGTLSIMRLPRSGQEDVEGGTVISGRWFQVEATQVLLGGLLPPGTILWDLEVEEDHSFVVEGLVSHNSNCLCYLEFERLGDIVGSDRPVEPGYEIEPDDEEALDIPEDEASELQLEVDELGKRMQWARAMYDATGDPEYLTIRRDANEELIDLQEEHGVRLVPRLEADAMSKVVSDGVDLGYEPVVEADNEKLTAGMDATLVDGVDFYHGALREWDTDQGHGTFETTDGDEFPVSSTADPPNVLMVEGKKNMLDRPWTIPEPKNDGFVSQIPGYQASYAEDIDPGFCNPGLREDVSPCDPTESMGIFRSVVERVPREHSFGLQFRVGFPTAKGSGFSTDAEVISFAGVMIDRGFTVKERTAAAFQAVGAHLASKFLTRQGREDYMERIRRVVATRASYALDLGEDEEAFSLLYEWSMTDPEGLHAIDPELADWFETEISEERVEPDESV